MHWQQIQSRTSSQLEHLADWLSQGGRLRLQQPWSLAPGPLLLVLALAFPYRWLFFLAYVWLALIIACYMWVSALSRSVTLRRTLHGAWAEVGDTLEETWELHNAAPVPLLWIEIDDASTLPGYSSRRAAAAGPRETQVWTTSARCTRRGLFALGPLTARLADPLNIFIASWELGSTRQIVVYPPLVVLPPLLAPSSPHGGQARADLLQQHTTPSVGGLREYQPGDQLGRIHWPTVARTRKLMIKEFDQERAGAIWIVLDLYAGSYRELQAPAPAASAGDGAHASAQSYSQSSAVLDTFEPRQLFDSPLELAIVLACSLAAQLLAEGRTVGLIADDGRTRVIPPDHGPRQLWRILAALVDAGATGARPLTQLLDPARGAIPARTAGSALAIVTPDLGGAWVAPLAAAYTRRQESPIALLITAPGRPPGELVGRLAGTGARTLTFETGAVLPLLHPPRPRVRGRVSPFGRVQSQ
jgi:uncharacterized protein (DUF58 family)